MARPRAAAEETHEARRLVGYRLLRGFVVFEGRTHRALLTGEVVAADDPVVPSLFRGGAELAPVME
jgi:hypothetical protein